MICQYKDIFGKPGEGVHSLRLLDVAVVDYVMTVAAAYAISSYYKVDYLKVHISLFLLAIILHRLFCVNTTVNKMIFGVV